MVGEGDPLDVERRARLLDALPEILVVIDEESRVTFAAGAFLAEANLGPEDLVGRMAWDLIHPDDLADSASSLTYLAGYDEGPVGPFVFRYLDRDGNVRIADAVGLNRSADPLIKGTVMLIRDVVGPQALEQAFESLALGEDLAVIAGHVLRAAESPPISGLGWVLAPTLPRHDDTGTRPTIELVAASPEAASLGSLLTDPGPWVLDLDAHDPVIDADLSTVPSELRDALHALGHRSLLAMPVRPPGSTHPALWLVVCNRWEEPSTANEVRTIRKYGSVLSVSFERIRLQTELSHAARHDGLTGLANRSSFLTHLEAQGRRADDETCALLYLDLDHFKPINDGMGHHVGDQVLVEVGRRITSCARGDDLVARLGGDEFAVLLPRTTVEQAEALAARITEAVARPIALDGSEVSVGVSIGVAAGPASELEGLLEHADTDMYRAKAAGRAHD
jgi:diguanylate cyclase (GGDEF)-like protein/PAS domain S-box-containing protein